jgi:hypothetical protein
VGITCRLEPHPLGLDRRPDRRLGEVRVGVALVDEVERLSVLRRRDHVAGPMRCERDPRQPHELARLLVRVRRLCVATNADVASRDRDPVAVLLL